MTIVHCEEKMCLNCEDGTCTLDEMDEGYEPGRAEIRITCLSARY